MAFNLSGRSCLFIVPNMEGNIWQIVEGIVSDEGLVLFDLEIPSGKQRVLRVVITRPNSKRTIQQGKDELEVKIAGINANDCARVSRRLSDVLDNELEIAGGSYLLEVTSPGINRKLRRVEHFIGAVGERIKMTVEIEGEPKRVARGKIIACDANQIEFEDEERKMRMSVPFSSIDDARVDFLF